MHPATPAGTSGHCYPTASLQARILAPDEPVAPGQVASPNDWVVLPGASGFVTRAQAIRAGRLFLNTNLGFGLLREPVDGWQARQIYDENWRKPEVVHFVVGDGD